MKVIFGKDHSITSYLIRIFTWSKYHHVGILLDDGRVLESTTKEGVHFSSVEDFKNRYTDYKICEVPSKRGWEDRAMKHLGRPYDWGAIFGLVLRKDWDNESRWFCAEHTAEAMGIFNREYVERVTPQHILMLGKEVK